MNYNASILAVMLLLTGGQAFAQKISPNTAIMLQNWQEERRAQATSEKKVDAFVAISDKSALEKMRLMGVEIRSELGSGLVTASIPLSAVKNVA